MNIQDWFPLGWTGWISLQSKGPLRVFSNTTVQKYQLFRAQLSLWSNSHMTTGKTIALTRQTFVGQVMSLFFNMLSSLVIDFNSKDQVSFNFMATVTICSDFGAQKWESRWWLYAGQEASVRTGHWTTDWFQIRKGVLQGCILSPCLFNLYAEYIMRNAGLDEAQDGIKIARRNINDLRYADGTTLMAESEEELKSLLMKVKRWEWKS